MPSVNGIATGVSMPGGGRIPTGAMPKVPDRGPKGSIMRDDGRVGILGGGPPKF
jgi:hypothetical protein